MLHPVITLRKLKWYILSKHFGNSSGTSCQNVSETQVVHPVETLRKFKWYIISKRVGNSTGTYWHCDFFERTSFADKRFDKIA